MDRYKKQARLCQTLSKFSKKELGRIGTRESFNKLIENLYGAGQARKVIDSLEASGVIPQYPKVEEINIKV